MLSHIHIGLLLRLSLLVVNEIKPMFKWRTGQTARSVGQQILVNKRDNSVKFSHVKFCSVPLGQTRTTKPCSFFFQWNYYFTFKGRFKTHIRSRTKQQLFCTICVSYYVCMWLMNHWIDVCRFNNLCLATNLTQLLLRLITLPANTSVNMIEDLLNWREKNVVYRFDKTPLLTEYNNYYIYI